MAVAAPCYEYLIYGPNAATATIPSTTDAIIPLTGKHKLTVQTIYSENEERAIYKKHTLELEVMMVLEYSTSGATNLEVEVQRIREILETPGLQLKLNTVGLGDIDTINFSDTDVKGGPFPQKTFVQPVESNNAIMIRWTVDFYLSADNCTSTPEIIDYSVEQDIEIDDSGNFGYVVNATVRTANSSQLTTALLDSVADILSINSGLSFQGMTKAKSIKTGRDGRSALITLKYKEVESDNAYFPYTKNIEVTDSLESSLMDGGAMKPGGFMKWARNIQGTVNLPPRVHAAYAWVVIVKILRERFLKLHPFSRLAPILENEAAQTIDNEVQTSFFYLPLKIRLTNRIYSRSVSFNVKYLVTSDLNNLLNNTKLFQRVNTEYPLLDDEGNTDYTQPSELSPQWETWQRGKDKQMDGYFSYGVSGLPVTFNQCTGTYSDHALASNRDAPYEEDPDKGSGEDGTGESPGYTGDNLIDIGTGGGGPQTDPTSQVRNAAYPEENIPVTDPNTSQPLTSRNYSTNPELNWISYKNETEIIEDPNQVAVAYLEEPPTDYYNGATSDPEYSNRSRQGLYLNGRQSNLGSQTNPQDAIPRGHSRWYVRIKGMAMRLNDKIPAPFLTDINGQTLTRVSCRVKHTEVSTGDAPVNMLLWDIVYVVTGQDIYSSSDLMSQINGTSAPGAYS